MWESDSYSGSGFLVLTTYSVFDVSVCVYVYSFMWIHMFVWLPMLICVEVRGQSLVLLSNHLPQELSM